MNELNFDNSSHFRPRDIVRKTKLCEKAVQTDGEVADEAMRAAMGFMQIPQRKTSRAPESVD